MKAIHAQAADNSGGKRRQNIRIQICKSCPSFFLFRAAYPALSYPAQ